MDLVGIERRYKNRKIILITICIIALLISAILYANIILNSQKVESEYKSFAKQYSLAIKIQKQESLKEQDKKYTTSQVQVPTQVQVQPQTTPNLTEQGKENMSNIYKSETKRVFLTFDDGPSRTVTIPILDLLKQENIKVTFFVLGGRVELYPDIVKRAYEEGHYIANHGYSHTYSKIYSSPQAVIDEYNKANSAVQVAIGNAEYNSHLFRFPGGKPGGKYTKIKNQAVSLLEQNSIAYVDWNCLTGDAEGKNTPEEMMQEIENTSKDKNSLVILMHDAGDKMKTYEVLPQVINYLRENGYEFKNFYDVIM